MKQLNELEKKQVVIDSSIYTFAAGAVSGVLASAPNMPLWFVFLGTVIMVLAALWMYVMARNFANELFVGARK